MAGAGRRCTVVPLAARLKTWEILFLPKLCTGISDLSVHDWIRETLSHFDSLAVNVVPLSGDISDELEHANGDGF